jgi:hypothetical protein
MSSLNKSVLLIKEDEIKKGSTWAKIVKQRLRKKHEGTFKIHLDQTPEARDEGHGDLQSMEEKIKSLKAKEEGGQTHDAIHSHSKKQSGYGDYEQYED